MAKNKFNKKNLWWIIPIALIILIGAIVSTDKVREKLNEEEKMPIEEEKVISNFICDNDYKFTYEWVNDEMDDLDLLYEETLLNENNIKNCEDERGITLNCIENNDCCFKKPCSRSLNSVKLDISWERLEEFYDDFPLRDPQRIKLVQNLFENG